MVTGLIIAIVLVTCVLWLLYEVTQAGVCTDPNCCPRKEYPVVMGWDKGSPDGDCTVFGYHDKDGVLHILEEQGASPEYVQKVKKELCGPFGRVMP